MMLSYFIMITSMMFMMLNHPILLSMMILIQTTLISLKIAMNIKITWFSYVLFLVMVGGMLVLFLYMTNVASNEKFYVSNKIIIMVMLMIPTTMIMSMNKNQKFKSINESIINYKYTLNKMFNETFSLMIIMMMIYLLITMIMAVKLTDLDKGPLRKKN
uniref:NADH-ubiquinone oxidoreductase chain 6 n=1 Tax=Rhadinosa nigrocyanea TaxID=2093842 RepID=A0A343UQA9_9CUCU|nr:NADH dehydrogenase subunit 6 [Rhadinosa nigrocyanea]AVF96884.1 NADH dehydrogenase subunit 6 [Rhadinosa nigrocyanea]